eukprot:scaffold44128_cov75-Cyclotella_meneghiniana.AAC.11
MSSSIRHKKPVRSFQQIRHRLSQKCLTCLFAVADQFMLVLGPVLILLASAIIVGLTYVYFLIILPMLAGTNWVTTGAEWGEYWKDLGYEEDRVENSDQNITIMSSILLAMSTCPGFAHTAVVCFFLINIVYNYYKCVTTSHKGKSYSSVVRDLAEATGFNYPETEEEVTICKQTLDKSIFNKIERRKREMMAAASAGVAANSTNGSCHKIDIESQQSESTADVNVSLQNNGVKSNTINKAVRIPKIRNWQLLSPTEWSWCRYSKQPKPPRSHYDHVTKSLVLNMIRATGELAKAAKKVIPVTHLKSNPFIPTPDEKTPVAFAFMMCLAVGIAVLCLASFHVYIATNAQTTIEFHGNVGKKLKGGVWKNPYSAGNRRKNWEMVYGSKARGCSGILLAMMPSNREPEFLPIPIDGKLVVRKRRDDNVQKKDDVELEAQERLSLVVSTDSDSGGLKERASKRSTGSKEVII